MSKRHAEEELYVFLDGRRAGSLTLNQGRLRFEYIDDSLPALSVQMPLNQKVYEGNVVEKWFFGVLPDSEGTRRSMARNKNYGHDSVFGLLSDYGSDLPGAVQVLSPSDMDKLEKESHYEALDDEAIGARLSEMIEKDNRSLGVRWHAENEHWSLAGGQPKFALMEKDGQFFECLGNAPSNVIIKPGVSHMNNQAAIEHLTMSIAQETGLLVANTKLVDFAGTQAIVIERYDRTWDDNDSIVRIHQEDMCQALGQLPEQKYMFGKNPTLYAGRLIKEHCDTRSMAAFVDSVLFNYLVGGTDGHLKNHSLLHNQDGSITLAPLYDIASRFPYFRKNDLMHTALGIGHERRIGRVGKKALSDMAEMLGIPKQAVFNRFEHLSEVIPAAADAVFEKLGNDIPDIERIHDSFVPRIAMNCEYAHRNLNTTHFLVPDFYEATGGISLFDGDETAEIMQKTQDEAEKAVFRDPTTGQVSSMNPHTDNKSNTATKLSTKHHKTTRTSYTSAHSYGDGPVYVHPHVRGGKKIGGYWRSRPHSK